MLLEGALTSSSTGELCAMALQALLDTVLVDKQAFGVRWGRVLGMRVGAVRWGCEVGLRVVGCF